MHPPILMFHGMQDDLVSIEHSQNFYEKLKHFDKEVEYYELENEGHRSPTFLGDAVLDIIERFLKKL